MTRLLSLACGLMLAVPFHAFADDDLDDVLQGLKRRAIDDAAEESYDAAKEGMKKGVKGKKKQQEEEASTEEEAPRPKKKKAPPTADEGGDATAAPADGPLEVYGNRFDFVPGSKVIVYDDFSETDVGEYPARWTTKEGGGNAAEVVASGGRRFFKSRAADEGAWAGLHWLRLASKGDMPKNFTIELDADMGGPFSLVFGNPVNSGGQELIFEQNQVRTGNVSNTVNLGKGLKHVSVSVSGTSVKAYVGGERVLNDPDAVERPIPRLGFSFGATSDRNERQMFTAFRLAEGGKDFKTMLAQGGRIVTHGILFDTGKDVIRPESGPALRGILELLQGDPKLRFSIEGHTDNQGTSKVNGPLSNRRAQAVKAWLVKQGIEGGRLAAKGLGDTKPMDTNATLEGRANNRRVEFVKL